MLVAKNKSAYEWRTIMQAISTIVDEAIFNANNEGILFRAMDPSHVALINIEWSKAAFEHYQCDTDMLFAVRVDEFLKLLKRADKDESIEVSIDNAGTQSLSLRLIKQDAKKSRYYRLRLLDISSSSTTPLPRLNFTTKVTMSPNAFSDALEDIKVISDQVTIVCNDSIVRFEGKGDAGEANVTFEQGNEVQEITVNEQEAKATYSMEYLLNMVKAIDAESIVLEYSSKMPLHLEFILPFACKIHYYLAPRIE